MTNDGRCRVAAVGSKMAAAYGFTSAVFRVVGVRGSAAAEVCVVVVVLGTNMAVRLAGGFFLLQ